jgi:hypothetical protein
MVLFCCGVSLQYGSNSFYPKFLTETIRSAPPPPRFQCVEIYLGYLASIDNRHLSNNPRNGELWKRALVGVLLRCPSTAQGLYNSR